MPSWLARAFPSVFSYGRPGSMVNTIRARRTRLVRLYLEQLQTPAGLVRILDVGGTYHYWAAAGFLDPARFHITLYNLCTPRLPDDAQGFDVIEGDARRLPVGRGAFDAVFSNSAIEHMGSRADQQRMADGIRRISDRYIVQTPCLYFPLEPHSHIPGFQFLPHWVRALLIRSFRINYFPAKETFSGCLEVSRSTLMLTRRGVQKLFPEARIIRERLFGLTKSYVAVHGYDEPRFGQSG